MYHHLRSLSTLAILGATIVTSTVSHAALFSVELFDFQGPNIKGIVDTTADTFTINSWTENSGGLAYWTASDLPRTYPATNASGGSFDVPDNWNGTIDNSWGFINPNSLPNAGYNEGTFFSGALAHDGWGGWITSSNSVSVAFNQTRWPVVPIHDRTASTIDFETVRIARVPEPATAVMTGLTLLGMLGRCRRRLESS